MHHSSAFVIEIMFSRYLMDFGRMVIMSRKVECLSLAFLMLLATGCSDDDPVAAQESALLPPELAATWSFSSVTQDGAAALLNDVLRWEPNTEKATLTLNKNGTFDYVEVTAEGERTYQSAGTFKVDGQAFSLVCSGPTSTGPPFTIVANSGSPPKAAGSLTGTWRTREMIAPECGHELILTATPTEFLLSHEALGTCPDW